MAQRVSGRRTLGDVLLSACALAVLVMLLVVMDGRVREEISTNMSGARASTEVAATTTEARVRFLVGVVKNESREHGPLLIMVTVGTLLALFMFRT